MEKKYYIWTFGYRNLKCHRNLYSYNHPKHCLLSQGATKTWSEINQSAATLSMPIRRKTHNRKHHSNHDCIVSYITEKHKQFPKVWFELSMRAFVKTTQHNKEGRNKRYHMQEILNVILQPLRRLPYHVNAIKQCMVRNGMQMIVK